MAKTKSEYRYQNVWQKVSEELSAEIVAFWKAESALPANGNPVNRAQQTVVVMRGKGGEIAAISTAILQTIPRLRQPMYYYRTFCAEKHRNNNTSIPIMLESQKALHEFNLGLEKPESIGILIEIENELISTHYSQAFWPPTQFSFIGYSQRGMVLRAHYFPDFRLQAPSNGA